jgi:hypothetical protein
MRYILKGVRAIVDDQLNVNVEAARDGSVEDWAAYRHLCGWIAGARYVLEVVAEPSAGRNPAPNGVEKSPANGKSAGLSV